MSEAVPYAPSTITGVGVYTDPLDFRPISGSVVLICHVSGTVTYVIEVSNDERSTRAYDTVATYTSSVVKRLTAAMPRFLRVRITSGSGSVAVGTGKALNADGKLTEVAEESLSS